MNGTYFNNPNFPDNYNLNTAPIGGTVPDDEQSFIENILRLNKGKNARAYFSFPDSTEWRNKVFEGIIDEAGKDHLVLHNTKTGTWQLILLIYLNYVEFDEEIIYSHSFSEKTY